MGCWVNDVLKSITKFFWLNKSIKQLIETLEVTQNYRTASDSVHSKQKEKNDG